MFERSAVSDIAAIYRDGRHYDRLFGSGPVNFWLSQARASTGPILELGCGTGKLSIPLAEAGFSVTGLDNSPALLRFAASKNRNVRWIEGDMRDFDLEERFALIMLPSNNLCHLHTVEDFQGCMSSVKRHLLPGGAFVIDVFVPNLNLLLQGTQVENLLSEYEDPSGGGRVRVMARSHYEQATQIRRTTTVHKIAGQPDQIGTLDLKMYFPRELEALVRLSGFRISTRYGGHSGEHFGDQSRFQVLVCEHSN
jgi:SAM-dependent methyltransferase